MPDYRLYRINSAGHISGPAQIITARDDAAAVSRAEQTLNGADIEVWQADRFIVRVTPSCKVREPAFPKAAGAPRLLG
jgi:hypothetical protein